MIDRRAGACCFWPTRKAAVRTTTVVAAVVAAAQDARAAAARGLTRALVAPAAAMRPIRAVGEETVRFLKAVPMVAQEVKRLRVLQALLRPPLH